MPSSLVLIRVALFSDMVLHFRLYDVITIVFDLEFFSMASSLLVSGMSHLSKLELLRLVLFILFGLLSLVL